MTRKLYVAAVLFVLAGAIFPVCAQAEDNSQSWLAHGIKAETDLVASLPSVTAEWEKPLPISFGIDYSMVSDYVFRGFNYSEYPGEGREKLNHQLGAWVEYDTGVAGAFGFYTWFEFYGGQDNQIPGASPLLENDYILYWRYHIEQIATTVELGWCAYAYPEYKGDATTTYEIYAKLSLDDSVLFGTDAPVLNPYVSYYHDIDLLASSGWLEIGISHTFALGDCGACSDCPFLRYLSITPSVALGIDHRQLGKVTGGSIGTRLATITYGLDLSFDLSSALKWPAQYGALSIGGVIYYSQSMSGKSLIRDEVWGGLKMSYSW